MEIRPQQKIFKISVSTGKTEWTHRIGQPINIDGNSAKIFEIEREPNSFFLNGVIRYTIWAELEKTREIVKYKTFEGHPVEIAYTI